MMKLFSNIDEIIKERKESLKDEAELQKILKKRHLDFLDILLCAKVSNGENFGFHGLIC